MAQGKDGSSFLSQLLEAGDSTPEETFTNKRSAMSLYTAGADTVSCHYYYRMLHFVRIIGLF